MFADVSTAVLTKYITRQQRLPRLLHLWVQSEPYNLVVSQPDAKAPSHPVSWSMTELQVVLKSTYLQWPGLPIVLLWLFTQLNLERPQKP